MATSTRSDTRLEIVERKVTLAGLTDIMFDRYAGDNKTMALTRFGRRKDKRMVNSEGEEKMKKQGTDRRKHTAEFKAEAVALAGKCEKPVSHVAVDLGVNESMLRRWMQEARSPPKRTGARSLAADGPATRS